MEDCHHRLRHAENRCKFSAKTAEEEAPHAGIQGDYRASSNRIRHAPRIVNGEETWISEYDPAIARKTTQWKYPMAPRPKKAKQSQKSYWSLSSMCGASDTVSSFHRARQSICKSTRRLCGVCFAQFAIGE